MSVTEPCELSIVEASAAIRSGDLSCVELVRSCLERIDRLDPHLNTFITTVPGEVVLRTAREADGRLAAGAAVGALHGIPVAHKDNISTAGIETTAGSPILSGHVPDEDAHVVRRLTEAGAITVGKLNMYEWAHSTTDNEHTGVIRNPWDPERVTGGSSSGSAVAVATRMCLGTTGNDAGGSIRIPAAFCGVVGVKPTAGLVGRSGTFPTSPSLDHTGPLAGSVADAALLLEAMAGPDPADTASVAVPERAYAEQLDSGLAGLRVAVDPYFLACADPAVRRSFASAVDRIAALGGEVREVSVPSLPSSLWAIRAIVNPESTWLHRERMRDRMSDFGTSLRRSLSAGATTTAVDYLEAQDIRRRLRAELTATLDAVDVLVTPTMLVEAPPLGSTTVRVEDRDYELYEIYLRCVVPFNLTGHPAVTLPYGYGQNGLPLGVQVVAGHFREAVMFRVARALESDFAASRREPDLAAAAG